LRQAELAQATAQARAEEETKRRALADELAREAEARADEARARVVIELSRRRRTVALAASLLVIAGLAGGGGSYLAWQRAERRAITERGVAAALAEARVWRDQARRAAAIGNLDQWATALAAAGHARGLMAQGEANAALRDQVGGELAALEREQEEAKSERRLLDELEGIRANRSEHWDPKQTDAEYAAAFRRFGIDLDQLDPNEAGNRIGKLSAPMELASYLDDWAIRRRSAQEKKDEMPWRRLLAAAQVADPDPWRVTLRDQTGHGDREAVRRLAANQSSLEEQPASSLVLLGSLLKNQGDRGTAEEALRRAWRLHPGDFWVNLELGSLRWTGHRHDRPEEAIRFHSACIAIRPRSHAAHNNLGNALNDQGKPEEAIAEFREALRLKPKYPAAHNNLGIAFLYQGKPDQAVAEFREALRLEPKLSEAHGNLGIALRDQAKLDEAVAQLREAIRLEPESPEPHNSLGTVLRDQGKLDEAVTEYREALRLKPKYPLAHCNLGNALRDQGKLDEAVAECHEALRLKPDYPEAHYNLGLALQHQGKVDQAMAECHEALRLKPDYPEAHCDLGLALGRQSHLLEALEELKQGHELVRKSPQWRHPSDKWVREIERMIELDQKLPAARAGKLKPADAIESLIFAQLCHAKMIYGGAAGFGAEGHQAQPKLADDMQAQSRYNAACSAALAGCGQGKDDPPLDKPAKARWRKQAIEWLKGDLAAWSKALKSGLPPVRQSVAETLQHWKVDPDLAGLREPGKLAKLPQDEQKACRALWAEAEAVLARARRQVTVNQSFKRSSRQNMLNLQRVGAVRAVDALRRRPGYAGGLPVRSG
jgi:tetratricopeptide (TPR) repeat protein